MTSALLKSLYEGERIFLEDGEKRKQTGKLSDTLGKIYEIYISSIFESIESLKHYLDFPEERKDFDEERKIIKEILSLINVSVAEISSIRSSREELPRTEAGGQPKTDVVLYIEKKDYSSRIVALNIKHSKQPKVSIAEYDVDTICNSVGITDKELISLMKKHQTDASAKNFTPEEKNKLQNLLNAHKEQLVRWCISLSSTPKINCEKYPEILIRFTVVDCQYKGVKIQTTEEYVRETIQNKSGFGTGLSWTYATGSKGKKIQFKG